MITAPPRKLRTSLLTLLLLGAACAPAVAQDVNATPVVWVNGVNVEVSGANLSEKCNGCSNAGAESQQMLTSGDGYVEFVAGPGVFAIGIGAGGSNGAPGTKLENIENGLYFNGNGAVEVRENGGVYQIDTRYRVGDRFRIALQNGVISYHKYEGNQLKVNYTSKNRAQIQYPAKVEAVLLGAGSQITSAVVRATSAQQQPAVAQAPQASQLQTRSGPLTWNNTSNVTVNGTTLVATGGQQNSGAQSNETLTGDGYIDFTAVEVNTMRAIGFDAQNDMSNSFQDIDFAIVLREAKDGRTGVAEVWEDGSYVSDTPYVAGDSFRIAIEGGVVKYYKTTTGQAQEIQARHSRVQNFPVHVDTAFYSEQASLGNLTGTRVN